MSRRHGDDRTRQDRTRQYPGGYEPRRPPDEGLYGPYHDQRGNRYFEDSRGTRYYDDDFREPYYRDYERDRYERDRRQGTGRTATRGLVLIAVALVVLVGMILVTNDFSSDPSDSAQQPPQQQQPIEPQQPAQQQPQAPAAPDQDGASSEQVEGMRADIERQLAEIRQSINQLRLEIWSFFGSEQNRQEQENSAQ